MSPVRHLRPLLHRLPETVLRDRPDAHGSGRRSQLERTLLGVHVVLLVFFTLVTLAPLVRTGGVAPGEVLLRSLLALLYAVVMLDLWRRGERLAHLAVLAAGATAALGLDQWWPYPGDISVPLTLSALAVSAARLFVLPVFAVVLLVLTVLHSLGRAVANDALSAGEVADNGLLTAALAISIAFFLGSLEDRTVTAERLDAQALARERELAREQGQQLAVTAASRLLHDDVLAALRLVADGDPAIADDDVRRAGRDCVAAVDRATS